MNDFEKELEQAYVKKTLEAKLKQADKILASDGVQEILTDIVKTRKVAIGGMIASGKSTLIGNLTEYLDNYGVIEEFRQDDDVFNTLLGWVYEKKPVELQLQTYFIDKHHKASKHNDNKDLAEALDVIKNHLLSTDLAERLKTELGRTNYTLTDRDIIEHWLFAQVNLKDKDNDTLMIYNNLFHSYYSSHAKPEVYYYLDIDWETFEQRVKNRGRDTEIENFNENVEYFKELLAMYKNKFEAQCKIHDIECVKIDVRNMTQNEVFTFVIKDMYDRGLLEGEPIVEAILETAGRELCDKYFEEFDYECSN